MCCVLRLRFTAKQFQNEKAAPPTAGGADLARLSQKAIKYDGTRHLFETTKDLELRFLMLASSISAACGDFNLTHYAAANSCMDDFALKQRAAGHVNVISTQWGALGIVGPVGGMAGDNTRKLMDMRGHGVVTEEQMVDFLETCIHQASDLPPVSRPQNETQRLFSTRTPLPLCCFYFSKMELGGARACSTGFCCCVCASPGRARAGRHALAAQHRQVHRPEARARGQYLAFLRSHLQRLRRCL